MRTDGDTIVMGTRGSSLAVRQTELIAGLLRQRHPSLRFAAEAIQTEGDRNQRDRITDIGDKGVFVRPLERALMEGRIDIAVHSLKDVPADVEPPELVLAGYSSREDPRDALVSGDRALLSDLSSGARVGTSSLRRRAQLRKVRPDLEVHDIRGNVDTRLRKMDEGQYDAIILAVAGLRRLRLEDRISEILSVDQFVPDAGQGIIAVQTRRDDRVADLVSDIDDHESRICALAERAVVRALGADCHSPVGAFASSSAEQFVLVAMAAPEDCSDLVRVRVGVDPAEPESGGYRAGLLLKEALENSSLY